MTNGAEIRFKDKKMEIQKGDAVFKFLPMNLDDCGFLFSIDGQRTICKSEIALVAHKNTTYDDKNLKEKKKVTFDEKPLKC